MYTGKQIFMESLVAEGVEFIFGNPGTTELPVIEALRDYPQVRYIMALHEAVAVTMADAYAHASGRVAVVNLHVAPGLGNGLGSVYNAWEGHTPMIVTAGQQNTRLRLREPLLGHDLVAMAAPLVKWSVQAESADELPLIMNRAFKTAREAPSGPVFVSLPMDVMEQQTRQPPIAPSRIFHRSAPDPDGLSIAVSLLARAAQPVIICGDGVVASGASKRADRTGRTDRGTGLRRGAPRPVEPAQPAPLFSRSQPAGPRADSRSDRRCGRDIVDRRRFFRRGLARRRVSVSRSGGCGFRSTRRRRASPAITGSTAVWWRIHWRPCTTLNEALAREMDEEARRSARSRMDALRAVKDAERREQLAKADAPRGGDRAMSPARLMTELDTSLPADVAISGEAITAASDLLRTLSLKQSGRLSRSARRRHRAGPAQHHRDEAGASRPAAAVSVR